jgi:hypothetical protein
VREPPTRGFNPLELGLQRASARLQRPPPSEIPAQVWLAPDGQHGVLGVLLRPQQPARGRYRTQKNGKTELHHASPTQVASTVGCVSAGAAHLLGGRRFQLDMI